MAVRRMAEDKQRTGHYSDGNITQFCIKVALKYEFSIGGDRMRW